MMKSGLLAGAVALAALATPSLAQAPSGPTAVARAAPQVTAIRTQRLIANPVSGNGAPALILVEAGQIKAILPGDAAVPEGAKLVDLSDATVLPGLIDTHVHLTGDPGRGPMTAVTVTPERSVATGAKNALITVKAGFTTVRDLGGSPFAVMGLRDSIRVGELPGPRIHAAGAGISIIGGHGDASGYRPEIVDALSENNTCTGAVQCAARVREASRRGVDVIKITATGGVLSQQGRGLGQHFTNDEMKSIVETATSLGLKVAAHAHGNSGIIGASNAGVASIEHGTFPDAATVKAMAGNRTWFVPTLMATAGLNDRLGKGVYTPVVEAKARQAVAVWGQGLNAAVKAGVPVAFGTDAGVFEHGRNAEEFALMVEKGGMTARAALVSATVGAADLMGLSDEVGTIAVGKAADIIAVDGDPLSDPRALEKMRFVMAAGRTIPLD